MRALPAACVRVPFIDPCFEALYRLHMASHTKRHTNVSIDVHLLEAARAHGMQLSALLEEAIRQRLTDHEKQRWLEENRDAIRAYNEQVSKHGVFSDGLRSF
jgi:antitoxin CcdA